MKELTAELLAKFVLAAFGATAIPLFALQHLPGYLDRGWFWPQIFMGTMVFIVWPAWGWVSYREIK